MERAAERARRTAPGVEVSTRLPVGDAREELVWVAPEADLLVLGWY